MNYVSIFNLKSDAKIIWTGLSFDLPTAIDGNPFEESPGVVPQTLLKLPPGVGVDDNINQIVNRTSLVAVIISTVCWRWGVVTQIVFEEVLLRVEARLIIWDWVNGARVCGEALCCVEENITWRFPRARELTGLVHISWQVFFEVLSAVKAKVLTFFQGYGELSTHVVGPNFFWENFRGVTWLPLTPYGIYLAQVNEAQDDYYHT